MRAKSWLNAHSWPFLQDPLLKYLHNCCRCSAGDFILFHAYVRFFFSFHAWFNIFVFIQIQKLCTTAHCSPLQSCSEWIRKKSDGLCCSVCCISRWILWHKKMYWYFHAHWRNKISLLVADCYIGFTIMNMYHFRTEFSRYKFWNRSCNKWVKTKQQKYSTVDVESQERGASYTGGLSLEREAQNHFVDEWTWSALGHPSQVRKREGNHYLILQQTVSDTDGTARFSPECRTRA